MAQPDLTETSSKALRDLEKCSDFHDQLVDDVETRWKAFEGELEMRSEAAQWQSQMHPPLLNHIVETTIAGLIEDRFAYEIAPKPRLWGPGEYEQAQLGAQAHTDLFDAQLRNDRFNEFQRPFALQAAVCRFAVAKTFWRREDAPRTRLAVTFEQHGMSSVPAMRPVTETLSVFNGPVTECVDVRDFYWDEAATSLENCRWVAHATWVSYADLVKDAKAGRYDMAAVEQLENQGTGEISADGVERDREKRGRKKDRIEKLEIWNIETGRVITIGGRRVTLREKKWPFWHGEYPFVVASLQPFPFSLQGMSIVEKLLHLQEAAWDLMNQRHDNLRFLNNFISILPSDVDDPDAFPFEPGAQWFMDDPQRAVQWAPNPTPAQVSLPAEAMLREMMQNLAGGQPFTSTSEANQINANTATEAALVTNLGQQALKAMKRQLMYAYERIGCQRLYLNQQFLRPGDLLEQIGLDSETEQAILPFFENEYAFDVTPMAESLMRQEKRAEANALFQIVAQTAPVVAALGSPWNVRSFQEDLVKAYEKPNVDRYVANPEPQQQQQTLPPGQPNPAQAIPTIGPQPNGVTAPQSIDPAVSPSAQQSLSPATFMQRNLALTGGAANAS